jgi:hypothetical protein
VNTENAEQVLLTFTKRKIHIFAAVKTKEIFDLLAGSELIYAYFITFTKRWRQFRVNKSQSASS